MTTPATPPDAQEPRRGRGRPPKQPLPPADDTEACATLRDVLHRQHARWRGIYDAAARAGDLKLAIEAGKRLDEVERSLLSMHRAAQIASLADDEARLALLLTAAVEDRSHVAAGQVDARLAQVRQRLAEEAARAQEAADAAQTPDAALDSFRDLLAAFPPHVRRHVGRYLLASAPAAKAAP